MEQKFTLNGKEYTAKPFDMNMMCDLEDIGINLDGRNIKQISLIRGYLSFCTGLSLEETGKELEKHIANGGKEAFTAISDVLAKEIDKSGFFQALK